MMFLKSRGFFQSNRARLLGACLAVFLGGCAYSDYPNGNDQPHDSAEDQVKDIPPKVSDDMKGTEGQYALADNDLEAVKDVSFDGNTINLTVTNNGCTSADHFQVEHVERNGYCEVSIVRTKPDFCRRAPRPMDISLTWDRPDTCDSAQLRVMNPLSDVVIKKPPADTGKKYE